ncbi:hypothetical protein L249_6314, partial [Ophiocordyceps polyrhachis-furcata BCC 54312]
GGQHLDIHGRAAPGIQGFKWKYTGLVDDEPDASLEAKAGAAVPGLPGVQSGG